MAWLCLYSFGAFFLVVALRLRDPFAMSLELGERPGFVGSHEAAITDNVGSDDGSQPALHTFFAHGMPLSWNAAEVAV